MANSELTFKFTEKQAKIIAVLTQQVRLGASCGSWQKDLISLSEMFWNFDSVELQEKELKFDVSIVGDDGRAITTIKSENVVIELGDLA